MPEVHLTKRNHLIDLLRILAASYVALFHFNEFTPFVHNWYRVFCKQGYVGVPVFFVISGYCICIAQQHAKNQQDFILKRFFRIFPPYWCSLLIITVIAIALKVFTGVNDATILPKAPDAIAATFLLLTTPFSHVGTINWVYWSLTYEVFFYVIVYLIFSAPQKLQMLLLYTVTIISAFIPHQTGILFFFDEWPLFCLGLAMFKFLEGTSYRFAYGILFITAALSFYHINQNVVFLAGAAITCLLILGNYWRPLPDNRVSRFGDVSYAVYLLHVPVGIYLLKRIKLLPYVQQNVGFNILADFCLLAIVVLMSYLFFKYIELPSIKAGKHLSRKLYSRADTEAVLSDEILISKPLS